MKPEKMKEFESAVQRSAPEGDLDKWDFADDDDWTEIVEGLTGDDVSAICNRGLHLHSLRRVRAALSDVQGRLLGRNHALEMMVACALAQTNLVFLGPPGTAKSLMVREFAKSLGVRPHNVPISKEDQEIDDRIQERKAARKAAKEGLAQANGSSSRGRRRMFEYLLTRYTTPEELFGSTDVQVLLTGGVYCRRTAGMLPQAEIAFLDEIFKANSAILNALLSLTNERIFYNMGQAFKVRMAFVVGASNETPDESELGALYDRFPIRVPCHPVSETMAHEVIELAHRHEIAQRLGAEGKKQSSTGNEGDSRRKACLNDLRLLSKVVLGGVYGGENAFGGNTAFEKAFMGLFLATRRDFGVSDRTPSQILRVCRALALIEDKSGQPAPELSFRHLRAWGYVAPKFTELHDLQRFVQAHIINRDETAAGRLFDVA